MTAIYTVKELIAAVDAGTITRDAAIAHCETILSRQTTSDNKRLRWTRVRDAFRAAKPITVAAAFATVQPEPAKPAAKPAPKAQEAQPKADPLTEITQRMAAQDARIDALVAAFTSLVERMPKPRAKKAA